MDTSTRDQPEEPKADPTWKFYLWAFWMIAISLGLTLLVTQLGPPGPANIQDMIGQDALRASD